MKEEVKQILKMVEEGKITAEEAIQLMEAGGLQEETRLENKEKSSKSKWLKVRVYEADSNKRKINVGIPLSLVEAGLKIGLKFGLGREELKGIDFNDIMQMIESGEEGRLVDVTDDKTGERVEIFVE